MIELRSLIEGLEEWLFKESRLRLFDVFAKEFAEAKAFKKLVTAMKCPACDKSLKLKKFERGPKGWEVEIICEGCNFKALLNSGWTNFENIDSIGRAREK